MKTNSETDALLEQFDCYSPGARRLYHFEFHGETQMLAQEARRTLDGIAAAAPARIAKGSLTHDEATQLATLWLAIAEDLEALSADHVDNRLRELRTKNGIAWKDKVGALRREISARRLGYPGEIDKGRLTKEQAKDQLDRLEAAHDLYWRHGYGFDGTRDELRSMSSAVIASYLPPAKQEEAA